MSLMYNEYIIASNNSINDNKYNAQKVAKSSAYKLKKMLKPLIRMLRSSSNKKQRINHQKSYESESSQEMFWSSEIEDNSCNEELESRIFREIQHCPEDAAVYVYDGQECERQSVARDQTFVPVHFARTEAGTFFWTTIQKQVDEDLIQPTYCQSAYQHPELQCRGDRWVQA